MYGTQPFAYPFWELLLFTLSMGFVIVSLHPLLGFTDLYSLPVFTFFGKRSLSYYPWFLSDSLGYSRPFEWLP